MRIGIDISQVFFATGVSTYTDNLVRSLLSIDSKNRYILFGGSLRRFAELKSWSNSHATVRGSYEAKIFPFPPKLLDFVWNSLHVFPVEYLTGKIDVFHSSDWTQPPSSAFKVTTIHDLAPLRYPRLHHPEIVAVHKRRLYWVKKEVDRIITVSKSTKADIVELLGVSESKISVIPEAADTIYKPQTKQRINEIKKKYKISRDYLLAVGVAPRKNLKNVVTAFKRLGGHNLSLVVAGGGEFKESSERGVIGLGNVPRQDLPPLYSGARALVYIPIYEGFGLPILEAFAAGCPVVCSKVSSIPALVGDAARLVDPKDVDQVRDGILSVLKNSEELVKKGLKRAKDFSWKKTAEETLKVYEETKK